MYIIFIIMLLFQNTKKINKKFQNKFDTLDDAIKNTDDNNIQFRELPNRRNVQLAEEQIEGIEILQLRLEERMRRDGIESRRMTMRMTEEQTNHLKNVRLRVKKIKQQQRQQRINQ